MSCFQLLKSPPSNSQSKLGCFCLEFIPRAHVKRIQIDYRRFRVSCKVEENDEKKSNGEEPAESLFMKELRRRGMNSSSSSSSSSSVEEKNKSINKDDEIKFREEDGGWNYARRNGVKINEESNLSNQREKSMALNSEGLEGLFPRAKLLLTLGGTFFLAFWPLILVTVGSFCALYLYFGPQFVHDGTHISISPPPYIDPYVLLEEERIYKSAPLVN